MRTSTKYALAIVALFLLLFMGMCSAALQGPQIEYDDPAPPPIYAG